MNLFENLNGLPEGVDTPLGIVLLVVVAFVALKAARLAVKLAMLPVVVAGLYLVADL